MLTEKQNRNQKNQSIYMKAELTIITDEMTGDTNLTKALNDNFNALNDMAHNREMAIFNRLNEMQKDIRDLKTDHGLKIDLLSQNMNKLMNHFNIEPDKELLTDQKQ